MALTGLTGTLRVILSASLTKSTDIEAASSTINKTIAEALTFGTGANQVNQAWADRRVLAGSAADSLDLKALASAMETVDFAKIKYVIIKNTSDEVTAEHTSSTSANIEISGVDSTSLPLGFKVDTDTFVVPAGGAFIVTHPGAGWTVTNESTDVLKITNGGATEAQYEIILIGVAA